MRYCVDNAYLARRLTQNTHSVTHAFPTFSTMLTSQYEPSWCELGFPAHLLHSRDRESEDIQQQSMPASLL